MTAEESLEIAKKVQHSEYDIAIALLEANRDGYKEGFEIVDKTLAVYQKREPVTTN
jgi:hypothetical protein